MTPRDEADRLIEQIRRHDHLYYVDGKSEISDREYDRLFQRLKDLETAHPELVTPDSPTQRVSETTLDGFVHVTHAVPMLSIDNTYNESELRDFDARVAKGLGGDPYEYLVEPKVDGVSATLRYEDGVLVLAATRGDGRSGDDITANVRTIKSVALRLNVGKSAIRNPQSAIPKVLEIRGEIYWPLDAFNRFNAQRVTRREEPFANPRNATTGALKSLDPKETASRGLAFVAHGAGVVEPSFAERASEFFDRLADWSIPVNPHRRLCKSIDEVIAFVHEWDKRRGDLPYQTDGLVIKIDRLDQRDLLGTTSRFPRWCIAYKFAAEQAETELLAVDFQVGKLGTITPRAVMKPVLLAGTTVRHASLHNFDQVERLGEGHGGLHEGDIVVIEKAGEIIPQVVRIAKPGKPRGKRVEPPKKCPVCKGDVEKDEGGVYIRCINPSCDAQIKERLKYFCGRDQMDIEGIGEALVEQLVDKDFVHDFADLYKLESRRAELVALTFEQERKADEGVKKQTVQLGEKRVEKLLAGIEASKSRPLSRVLAALNIRHVGSSTAELLAEHFGEMGKIVDTAAFQSRERKRPAHSVSEHIEPVGGARGSEKQSDPLQAIDGIGHEVAASIRHFFTSEAGNNIVARLAAAGVNMTQPKRAATGNQPFAGMTIVPTGTFEKFSRQEIQQAIKDAGGKAAGSVSKNTTFVVAGEAAGSKLEKARELGVEVIDEAEFIRRIGAK